MDNKTGNNPISAFFEYLGAMLINQIVAPLALFLLVMTLVALVLLTFGKIEIFGQTGKLAVGIAVPLFILLCLRFKRFGNAVFVGWVFVLYIIFILTPPLAIVYVCLKPALDYLS